MQFPMAAYATMAAIPTSYPVLVFPADGRAPHIADMPVTQAGSDYYAYPLYAPAPALVPRPEIHMEYIAEGLGQPAHRSVVRASPRPRVARAHTPSHSAWTRLPA
jgi:hypothetical protein